MSAVEKRFILKISSHRSLALISILAAYFPAYCNRLHTFAEAFTYTPCVISKRHLTSLPINSKGLKMDESGPKKSRFFAQKEDGASDDSSKRGMTTRRQKKKVKREEICTNNTDPQTTTKRERLLKKAKVEADRTQSFDPQWHGTFVPKTSMKVHTLVLGTHPSIASLSKVQYFGHPMNAFWWIAGDCLGFRRASAISPSTGKPYKLASSLYHGEDKIIPYDKQLELFTSKGFALWDIIASCERPGSLDVDIKEEKPNSIREFCEDHPTIKRIIMVNGGKQCTFFSKYFQDWWLSGELKPGDNELSKKAFRKFAKKTNNFEKGSIECICLPSVSPAAASITYEEKREAFSKYCYTPGLLDHKQLSK